MYYFSLPNFLRHNNPYFILHNKNKFQEGHLPCTLSYAGMPKWVLSKSTGWGLWSVKLRAWIAKSSCADDTVAQVCVREQQLCEANLTVRHNAWNFHVDWGRRSHSLYLRYTASLSKKFISRSLLLIIYPCIWCFMKVQICV